MTICCITLVNDLASVEQRQIIDVIHGEFEHSHKYEVTIYVGKTDQDKHFRGSGIDMYFVDAHRISRIDAILRLHNIDEDDVFVTYYIDPGSNISNEQVPEELRRRFKLYMTFGDLHHLGNPLTYCYSSAIEHNPDFIFF